MSFARFSISLFGAAAAMAATLAAATIWLLLTDPITVADAVKDGQVTPLVRALAGVLYDAFRGILKNI
jgi:hypothetical protein